MPATVGWSQLPQDTAHPPSAPGPQRTADGGEDRLVRGIVGGQFSITSRIARFRSGLRASARRSVSSISPLSASR